MPLFHTASLADGALLGVWRIAETAEALCSLLSRPDLYADRVAGLKRGSRREQEVLAVRCLLRALTGEEQRVVYDGDGRPSLSPFSPSLSRFPFLSISHTDGYAAVLLGTHPVGIDIERRGQRVERVVTHFLQPAERELLTTPLDLHVAWSAKEAAYKVLGHAYYDLQHLTRIARVHYDYTSAGNDTEGMLLLDVAGRAPMSLRFRTTEDFVLVWTP